MLRWTTRFDEEDKEFIDPNGVADSRPASRPASWAARTWQISAVSWLGSRPASAHRACSHGDDLDVRWRRDGQVLRVRDGCANHGRSPATDLAEEIGRVLTVDRLRIAPVCPATEPEDERVTQTEVRRVVPGTFTWQ